MSADVKSVQILHDALKSAEKAVALEQQGERLQASIYYQNAATMIHDALILSPNLPRRDEFLIREQQYMEAGRRLGFDTSTNYAKPPPSQRSLDERQGMSLLDDGEELLSKHLFASAKKKFVEAAGLLLKAKASAPTVVDRERIEKACETAISKAERLSGMFTSDGGQTPPHLVLTQQSKPASSSLSPSTSVTTTTNASSSIRTPSSINVNPRRSPSPHPHRSHSTITDDEKSIIAFTSKVNKNVYLPWQDEDANDDFGNGGKLFTDPDGPVPLREKQRVRAKLARPSQFMQRPVIFHQMLAANIKQTIIPDCSFISSLAISADYEVKKGVALISQSIFPQHNGKPIYNKYGKYSVKLHFNGCWRRVIIDDVFPVTSLGELLCSFSKDESELWVSIFEKAYMKVMGGYSFPGSNSAVDLHALTGWIPDRLNVKDCDEVMWTTLWEGLHRGDCLLTVATGDLSEEVADRAGLVPTHAYAIVEMRKGHGVNVLRLKNPWAHKQWRGNYSPFDKKNWTTDMKKMLQYEPEKHVEHDDGEFWIDWDSLSHFFDVMYMNWNPAPLPFGTTHHYCWKASGKGARKDLYNMQYNPQYVLRIDEKKNHGRVWLLLSRHITSRDDFANNKEFITLHVYEGGKRVYFPDDPLSQGVKINSPHYLCKLGVEPGKKYTVVVSQYERDSTIRFTLKSFGDVAHKFDPLPDIYPVEFKLTSKWTAATAGGRNRASESFKMNPRFSFKTPPSSGKCRVFLKLEAPKEFSVGMMVTDVDGFVVGDQHEYRPGFTKMELSLEPDTKFLVIPHTFTAGRTGSFFLTIGHTTKLTLSPF
eukprot:m.56673 g.56673  ORF g.56673 m.56673 type:complete len:820 (+) comp7811_c0_seq1:113-2572(+)